MLSFKDDEYTLNLMEGGGRWVVTLNDGNRVYQDDDRPEMNPKSAWERLGLVCEANKLYIVDMYLQFRSHLEHLPSNADGYYFAKSIMGSFGSDKNWHFYVVGTLKNGILKVDTWKLPELIINESEERSIEDAGINLIRRQ
jgi:hypothetical protein